MCYFEVPRLIFLALKFRRPRRYVLLPLPGMEGDKQGEARRLGWID